MFAAAAVVSIILATLMVFAAVRKLTHEPSVVESYRRAGVPEDRLNLLAAVLLAAASGLVVGLRWAPIGVAAASGTVGYFLVAIGFHVRAKDAANSWTPVILALLAVAALVLRVGTT